MSVPVVGADSNKHTKIPGLVELIFYCAETDNKK